MSAQRRKRMAVGEGRRGSSAVSRRTFVRGIVAASMAAGLPTPHVFGFSTEGTSAGAAPVSRHKVLRAVLNRVIPGEGGMPAAGDLGVAAFVDEAAGASVRLRRQVGRVIGACRRESGAARSPHAIDRALRRLEHDRPADFDFFIQAVFAGYYTHPRVLTALGDPRT